MDTAILTAIVQGVIQIVTIVGTIWGLFNKQQKQIEVKLNKRMDRMETMLYTSQRSSEVPKL